MNKYLAECGVCSRREADKLISQGRVTIDGKVADVGATVPDGALVAVSGKPVRRKKKKTVIAYYKPVGVTCTEKDPHAEKIITDVIKYPGRVTYAGRLDKDSEGLMLMTNDGDLIHAMMHGSNRHEKEYIVRVNKEVEEKHLWMMREGVYLEELKQRTRPCKIERKGKYTYRFILTQGLNRQIRRMFKLFGYRVIFIRRVRMLNITLDDMCAGDMRPIEGADLAELYRLVGLLEDDEDRKEKERRGRPGPHELIKEDVLHADDKVHAGKARASKARADKTHAERPKGLKVYKTDEKRR